MLWSKFRVSLFGDLNIRINCNDFYDVQSSMFYKYHLIHTTLFQNWSALNSCHFVNVEKQNKICLIHSWEVIICFIFYSIHLLLQTSPKKYVCKVKQSLYDVTKLHIKNILAGNQQPNTINWKYFEVEYKEHVKHFR